MDEKPRMFKWTPMFYATYYGILMGIARKYGYALALHGTLTRDMDLIAVPWVDEPGDYVSMLEEMKEVVGFNVEGDKLCEPEIKPHGRVGYAFSTGCGYVDISVMLPKREVVNELP